MEITEIKKNFQNSILDYYEKNGIKWNFNDTLDFHMLLIDYFEILRKHILPKYREVCISKELKIKMKSPVYSKWYKRFNEIKTKFEKGEDMNPLLSKRANENGFKDRLLTCWKIHHLHFYPEKKSGDMLLFVIVTDKKVYMVDVIPHSKKYVFSTFDLLKIVHTNWREIFEPFRLKDVTGLTEIITKDSEINALRKCGVSTAVQLGKDVYALDMMAADGHSVLDVMYANKICNSLRINEKKDYFKNCRLFDFSLTYQMHPCFILTYYDKYGVLNVWKI